MSDKALVSLAILLLSLHTASCQVLDTDNFLIVADTSLNSIYHIEYVTGATNELLIPHDDEALPFAVAYDPSNMFFYYSDHWYKTIRRCSLLWRNCSTIYQKDTARIQGLAIDPERQKLYYTDSGNRLVGEMSTDGTERRSLVEVRGSKPRAIVVDSVNRMLYWTDWSTTHPGIYRSSLSTVSRIPIITTKTTWPNALAIDFTAGLMYFGDGKLDTIERSNLNGSDRVVLLNESTTNSHYFALALDSEYLYYTDWSVSSQNNYIRKMHRTSLETSTVASSVSFRAVNGLVRFVSPSAPTTTEAQTVAGLIVSSTTTGRSATVGSSSLSQIMIVGLSSGVGGAVLTVLVIVICAVVACKWRRRLIEKATLEEQRRQEALQHEQKAPFDTNQYISSDSDNRRHLYEQIDIGASGYSIPDFAASAHFPNDNYEKLGGAPALPRRIDSRQTTGPDPDYILPLP